MPIHARWVADLAAGLLVDPQRLRPLRLSDDGRSLLDDEGGAYPIEDGIPRLLRSARIPPEAQAKPPSPS